MPAVYIKRGTRSQIDTAAGALGLNAGEPYLITDENRIAVGLSTSTYEEFIEAPPASAGIWAWKHGTGWVDITNSLTDPP